MNPLLDHAADAGVAIDLGHFPPSAFGDLAELDFLVLDCLAVRADPDIERSPTYAAYGVHVSLLMGAGSHFGCSSTASE
jgi:hypothetical protein